MWGILDAVINQNNGLISVASGIFAITERANVGVVSVITLVAPLLARFVFYRPGNEQFGVISGTRVMLRPPS